MEQTLSSFTKNGFYSSCPYDLPGHRQTNLLYRFDFSCFFLVLILLGFATLSQLDAGWYGKGMYFTSSAMYSLLYMKSQSPAIILCWALPGHVYPLTEHPNQPGSMWGQALQAGFDSHYVLTTYGGFPAPPPAQTSPGTIGKGLFDEIVINQEQQVIPAFIITFKPENLQQLWNSYQEAAKGEKLKKQMGQQEQGDNRHIFEALNPQAMNSLLQVRLSQGENPQVTQDVTQERVSLQIQVESESEEELTSDASTAYLLQDQTLS